MHLHVGRTLPEHLVPYAPGPHTLGRFLENTFNPENPAPNPEPADDLEPRQNQYEAADAIAERAAAGGRQFLLADRSEERREGKEGGTRGKAASEQKSEDG